MAQIAEALRHMLAAGMPAEAIVAAVADMEACAAAETAPARSNGAERTRRWRERKASQSVTVTSQASRDVTPSPPKNVPPHPPINTPHSSEAIASGGEPPIEDPSETERELFVRGKRVLGSQAGGMVAKLKSHFGGNVALARAAIETASTKHDPRQYVGALLRGPPGGVGNVVTLDRFGAPIDDQSASQVRAYPSGGPNCAGSRAREAAAFIAGFCREPQR